MLELWFVGGMFFAATHVSTVERLFFDVLVE